MIVTAGKIYEVCDYCNNLVRLNKPIIGSMHICVSPEQRNYIDRCNEAKKSQMNFQSKSSGFLGSDLSNPIKKYLGMK